MYWEHLSNSKIYHSSLSVQENKTMKQANKTIILGVTGGIAIHKSIDLASQLVKQGHSVHVVMTENATRLVQPIQFQVISRNPVLLDLFDIGSDWKPVHIDLADKADLLAIVPATANIIGKNGERHRRRRTLHRRDLRPLPDPESPPRWNNTCTKTHLSQQTCKA